MGDAIKVGDNVDGIGGGPVDGVEKRKVGVRGGDGGGHRNGVGCEQFVAPLLIPHDMVLVAVLQDAVSVPILIVDKQFGAQNCAGVQLAAADAGCCG